MRIATTFMLTAVMGATGFGLLGCDKKEDTSTSTANTAANNAAASSNADAAKNAMSNAGDSIKDAANQTGSAISDAATAAKQKMAASLPSTMP
jgi:hypothetical protein